MSEKLQYPSTLNNDAFWNATPIHDFFFTSSKLLVDYGRLNFDYMSIYLDSFQKTLKKLQENGKWDSFYNDWLANTDSEFDRELGSNRFSSILANYMSSFVEFRFACRKLGWQVDLYDVSLYHMKKNFLNSIFFSSTEEYSTPFDVVYNKGRVRLLHYGTTGVPILIVYAQINRFHIMDINAERSVVKALLDRGLDVYVLDWGYSGKEDDHHSLHDYVETMGEVVGVIKDKTGLDKVPVIGYCWGGIVSLVYAALNKSDIQCLALLATPVDFSKDVTLLSTWVKTVDADKMIGEYGHMDGQLLDMAFVMRNPPRNMYDKYLTMFKNIANRDILNNFVSVEKWLFSTPPVPGALWRQLVNDGYKQNLLIKGEMKVGNRTVLLKELDMPIFCGTAEKDDLVSPASTIAINDHVSSTDKISIQIPGGHVGLCIGKVAHEKLWPKIVEWVISRASSIPKKSTKKVSQQDLLSLGQTV